MEAQFMLNLGGPFCAPIEIQKAVRPGIGEFSGVFLVEPGSTKVWVRGWRAYVEKSIDRVLRKVSIIAGRKGGRGASSPSQGRKVRQSWVQG